MTTQIQIRRDTSANWSSVNPVLAEGEIGMDMTVNAFKVGDGSSSWSEIEYAGSDISLDDYYTKVETDDTFQPKGDYLTDFVEEDPTVPDHVKAITQDNIDSWNAPPAAVDAYTKAESDGKYEPKIATKNSAFNKNFGSTSGTVAQGNHNHDGTYAKVGDSYTKAESDNKYEVKGSGGGLTQEQGDARYVMKSGNSTVSGTITATDFIAKSDERVKKNVCTAPTGVLEKIRGVDFEWKESGQMASGVIAQELEAVPELAHLVHYGEEDGTKHVSYLGLIGYLIEEVKALKAEVEALKS